MRSIFTLTFCCLLPYSVMSQQWVQTNGPEGGYISSICAVGDTYFAATWDGVFTSSDNGDTWSASGVWPDILFGLSVAHDTIVYTAGLSGIHRSFDRGKSWNLISNFVALTLLVKGDTLFANGAPPSGGPIETYRSIDNGNTWTTTAGNGLPAYHALALAKDGNKFFAGTAAGLFVSTDLGENWVPLNNGINNLQINALYFNGSTLFAGGNNPNGLYKSVDYGASWVGVGDMSVSAITGDGLNMYVATTDGVYRSNDNGTSWTQLNTGLINTQMVSLFVNGSQVFAGSYGDGVYISKDSGDTWSSKKKGLKSTWVSALGANDSLVFAGAGGYGWHGLYKSNDNGLTWSDLKITSTWNYDNTQIYSIVPGKNSILVGSNYGIIRSTNSGQTWQTSSLPSTIQVIQGFAVSGDTLWASEMGGGIIRSTDDGIHWSLVGTIPNLNTWINLNTLVVNGSSIFVGTHNGIFVSRDKGISWSFANTGLTNKAVLSLAKIGDVLVAGTENGIFVSKNNGVSWLPTGTGAIICLYVYGPTIYAADLNNGVSYSTDNGSTWTQLGESFGSLHSLCALKGKLFAGTYYHAVWTTSICNPPPQPTITITYGLHGEIIFNSNSAQGNQWFLNGKTITGATDSIYSTTISGNYSVQVTVGGCKSAFSSLAHCSTPPQPVITKGSIQPFEVILNSSSANGNQWFLNGTPITGANDSVYTATFYGNYTLQVNSGGCKSEMSTSFGFEPDPQIDMPNVFTPNGDDKNPVFKPITYNNVQSGFLTIINRWGKQIFQTSDPESGWDGGKSEEGVYYYQLHYSGLNGKSGTVKGWVQIIR